MLLLALLHFVDAALEVALDGIGEGVGLDPVLGGSGILAEPVVEGAAIHVVAFAFVGDAADVGGGDGGIAAEGVPDEVLDDAVVHIAGVAIDHVCGAGGVGGGDGADDAAEGVGAGFAGGEGFEVGECACFIGAGPGGDDVVHAAL